MVPADNLDIAKMGEGNVRATLETLSELLRNAVVERRLRTFDDDFLFCCDHQPIILDPDNHRG
jgi:hypothetical protein